MEILKKITAGNDNIEAIRNQLFDVIMIPTPQPSVAKVKRVIDAHNKVAIDKQTPLINLDPEFKPFDAPNSFTSYSSKGGQPLGSLGKDFVPTQPKFLLDNFETCLIDINADLSKLKYFTFKDNKKVCFRAPIREYSFINKAKVDDVTKMFMNIQTGFDGYTKTSMFISVERLICENGWKATRTEFTAAFKNTKGNFSKASALCDDVAKAVEHLEKYADIMKILNGVDVDTLDVDKFLLKTLGYNRKDLDEQTSAKKRIFNDINESIALEFGRTGSTLWGLVNGFTHYTNHVANTKNLDDYIYVDRGAKLNDVAQRVAIEMIN